MPYKLRFGGAFFFDSKGGVSSPPCPVKVWWRPASGPPGAANGSLGLVVADADIQHAAKQLVERYGDSALAVAQERVEALSNSQDQSEVNVALRVLSAVEFLLACERP